MNEMSASYEWFELVVDSLRHHAQQHLAMWLALTAMYSATWAVFRYRHRFLQCASTVAFQPPPVYQSRGALGHFRVSHSKLTRDNAVYLGDFECDRYACGLLVHFVYGLPMYFTDPVNLFCLLVAMGQVYEYCNASAFHVCVRSTVPLAVFAVLSASMYTFGISNLLHKQMQVNGKRFAVCRQYPPHDRREAVVLPLQHVPQHTLTRGTLIRLRADDVVPADALLLHCQDPVLTEEVELTGEREYTSKMARCREWPAPDSVLVINHFQSQGQLNSVCYTGQNVVYAGTRVVDGDAWGLVIETGNDCQIYRVDRRRAARRKSTAVCMFNLYSMLFLAAFASLVAYHKTHDAGAPLSWRQLWPIWRKMILLLNTTVPLSLQFFFEAASVLLSRRMEQSVGVQVNRNGVVAFQSEPQHIVSDKTGTLTRNELTLESAWG